MRQITMGTILECAHAWTELRDDLHDTPECACGGVICMDCGAEWEKEKEL